MDSKNPQAQSTSNAPSTSSSGPESRCPFDNLVMMSFRVTLNEYSYDHPREIIQMAATVLYGPGPNWSVNPETDFSDYVRPTRHPILSDYCKDVTGTSQENIDKADEFPRVFEKFEKWLETTGIAKSNFAVVTEARADIWQFAQYQFILCNMTLPIYLKRYISAFELFHGVNDRLTLAAKPKEEDEKCLENNKQAAEKKVKEAKAEVEVSNPDMNDSYEDHNDREDSGESSQEGPAEYEVHPIDPNDPVHAVFDRGLAEADRRDQLRLAEAVHREQEGVYSPPETEESGESDEYNRSAEELAIPNVMGAVEQPRARKRGSNESIDFEQSAGLDGVPLKKLRVGKKPFVEYLCKFYNIQRTGKRYNAVDDAATLRDVIYEMLKDTKIVFYFNCMLVCLDNSRKGTWQNKLLPDWRQNFHFVQIVYERVLPLFCRQLKLKENVDFTKCITCEKPLEECGSDWIHKQFPSYLFDSTKMICGKILFATEAGLEIDKSIGSVLNDSEKDLHSIEKSLNGDEKDSDGGDGHSNGGEKDL